MLQFELRPYHEVTTGTIIVTDEIRAGIDAIVRYMNPMAPVERDATPAEAELVTRAAELLQHAHPIANDHIDYQQAVNDQQENLRDLARRNWEEKADTLLDNWGITLPAHANSDLKFAIVRCVNMLRMIENVPVDSPTYTQTRVSVGAIALSLPTIAELGHNASGETLRAVREAGHQPAYKDFWFEVAAYVAAHY